MYLRQFFVEGLGHASYVVGSDETSEAAVVDPRRDIEDYVEAAHRAGLVVRYVLETHVHNDFVSGAKPLADRLGAEYVASAEAGLRFPYRGVRDGDELRLGELRIHVLKTPGHTPEHVSFVVVDTSRADEPFLVFSGGDLLVGSVGRPDLLGRALGEQLAPLLYDSLHDKLMKLPDHVLVMPTHGGGSLCGKNIASTSLTTIGFERRFNPALQQPSREAFVEFVLSGNPGIPAYYARMRPTNQAGPTPAPALPPRPLPPEEVQHLAGHGAVVLDTRSDHAFGGGHVPGAINVGLGPMFATWVGWLVPADAPLIFVFDGDDDWEEATTALTRIGYERFAGYLQGGMANWVARALPVERIEQVTVQELHRRLSQAEAVQVLDVRMDAEWQSGHIPQARHLMLGDLPERLGELQLDPDRPVAVVCGSGYRSSIATSLLRQRGFRQLWNILGGMTAWNRAGLPTGVDEGAPGARGRASRRQNSASAG